MIGAGSYPESVSPDKDLTFWGACVRQVLIAAPGPQAGGDAGTVLVAGDQRVDLVNLRISGEQIGVRVSASGAVVTLQGVWIHQATRYGVLADAGGINLSGVLVSSTRSPADGQSGIGLGLCQIISPLKYHPSTSKASATRHGIPHRSLCLSPLCSLGVEVFDFLCPPSWLVSNPFP